MFPPTARNVQMDLLLHLKKHQVHKLRIASHAQKVNSENNLEQLRASRI